MYDLFPILDDDSDVGIRQFNLDPDSELAEMYSRAVPDDYAVIVTLFYQDDVGNTNASAFLEGLLAEGKFTLVPEFELAPKRKTYLSVQRLPGFVRDGMSSAQMAWWHRGVYVECGFWCPDRAEDESFLRSISVAMTWHDATLKPNSNHRTIRSEVRAFDAEYPYDPTPSALARNYRLIVGDIFRERVGIWSKDLVMPRNEILIKVRALLAGEDPAAEWERFKLLGMTYHLDNGIGSTTTH